MEVNIRKDAYKNNMFIYLKLEKKEATNWIMN